jgi:AcrR family transcriptional regulator
MASSTPRPQARPRRRTRADSSQAIINSGLQVLEERNWESLTIAEVARRAGVSVGGVYNRFADKEALTFALHEAFVAGLVEESSTWAAPPSPSLADCVHGLVRTHCELMSAHEPLMAVFMHRTSVDARLAPAASAATQAIGRRFIERVLAHRAEIQRADPALAAGICFEMVHDVVARRIARGGTFESDVELSWERITEELSRVCVAYLSASTPA